MVFLAKTLQYLSKGIISAIKHCYVSIIHRFQFFKNLETQKMRIISISNFH